MSNSHGAWTTANELGYIATLGRNCPDHPNPLPRAEWLKNYFHAMQRRKNWDGIDRNAVLKAIFNAMMQAQEVERGPA